MSERFVEGVRLSRQDHGRGRGSVSGPRWQGTAQGPMGKAYGKQALPLSGG